MDWLESRFGLIPMALSSWVRIVGDVWLVGTHPRWPESSAADPLVLEVEGSRYPDASMHDHVEAEFDAWQEWSHGGEGGRFELPVAPDRLDSPTSVEVTLTGSPSLTGQQKHAQRRV